MQFNQHQPESRPERAQVLVVDDDPVVLAGIQHIIRQAEMDCEGVNSLHLAKARLNEGQPDLVVTDIMLGDGTGLELLQWVSDTYPELPVILVTGRPDTTHITDAVRYRACDYVAKPVNPTMLLAAIAKALERSRLVKDLIQTKEMNAILCQVLARAVEAKDHFTAGHSARVAGYAEHLGRKLGLGERTARDLHMAGQLHDIGKIGIEDQVLTAPRKLTDEEWQQIRNHPATAVDILQPLPRLEEVRQWIFEHHERWDGAGYPKGVGGEDITLPGRILILVEVFDALHTRRSYKAAWSMEKILDYYREQRGKHFDPELCDLFVDGLAQEGMAFLGMDRQQELFC